MAWPDSTSKDTGGGTLNPYDAQMEADIDAQATAGNDNDIEIGHAPMTGTVSKVELIPDATQNGADTNSRTLTLKNVTQSNATVASLAMTNGVNLTANTEKDLTLGAGVAVNEGDVLELNSAHVGTGLAFPGGKLIVHIRPTLGQTP